MNVSNLQTLGHYFTGADSVFIETSRYQWTHNAVSAVNLVGVRRHAIIDRSEFVELGGGPPNDAGSFPTPGKRPN